MQIYVLVVLRVLQKRGASSKELVELLEHTDFIQEYENPIAVYLRAVPVT